MSSEILTLARRRRRKKKHNQNEKEIWNQITNILLMRKTLRKSRWETWFYFKDFENKRLSVLWLTISYDILLAIWELVADYLLPLTVYTRAWHHRAGLSLSLFHAQMTQYSGNNYSQDIRCWLHSRAPRTSETKVHFMIVHVLFINIRLAAASSDLYQQSHT